MKIWTFDPTIIALVAVLDEIFPGKMTLSDGVEVETDNQALAEIINLAQEERETMTTKTTETIQLPDEFPAETRKCKECGAEFAPKFGLQAYCDGCREVRRALGVNTKVYEPKTCEHCGKEFTPTGSRQVRCPDCRKKKNGEAEPEPAFGAGVQVITLDDTTRIMGSIRRNGSISARKF